MSSKKLTVLGIFAVLIVIWAVVQDRIGSNKPKVEPTGPSFLIQGLDPTDIAKIVIGTPNNITTLTLTDVGFVVAELDNYPALAEKISRLITTCQEVKTLELYADDAESHEELGVTEGTAKSFVKFFRADSSMLMGIIVGKDGERPPTGYVRMVTSDNVYLVERFPWILTKGVDYVETKVVSVGVEDVESVSVISAEEEYTITAGEPGKGGIVFKNIPPGKRLEGSKHELVFDALWDLTFDGVFRVGKKELDFDRSFICRIKDSTVFSVEIAQLDGRTYAICQADFTDEIPPEDETESEEQREEREAKLAGNAKAKEFTAKHAGWVYRIYEYKAARFLYDLSDLLEDIEQPVP